MICAEAPALLLGEPSLRDASKDPDALQSRQGVLAAIDARLDVVTRDRVDREEAKRIHVRPSTSVRSRARVARPSFVAEDSNEVGPKNRRDVAADLGTNARVRASMIPSEGGRADIVPVGDALSNAALADSETKSRLAGSHRVASPRCQCEGLSLDGRLPADTIQRIVRGNMEEFRLCYEAALRTKRTLSGRVTSQFLIDQRGSVSKVAILDSVLPPETDACIAHVFASLSFPAPAGGTVTVTYPLVLSPT